MLQNVTTAVMNGLLVSIPESFIWILTVFILIKRFDLLDKYRWRENIKWLMLPALSSAILINIMRYIINTPRIFISLGAVIAIYIGIIIVLKSPQNNILKEKIDYLKILLLVILSFAFLIILPECLYAPLLLKYIGKSISEVNNIWLTNFILSTPARVIQFFIIIFILSMQNKKAYHSIIQSILSDKKISWVITIFISVLIVFWTLLINIFGNYNVLSQYGFSQQIIFSILLFLTPSILLILMISLVVLFIERINKLNRSHQNMFDDVFDDDI